MARAFTRAEVLVLKLLGLGVLVLVAFALGVARWSMAPQIEMQEPAAQPIPFSHKHHVSDDGIDCRYCHNGVEKSWYSNVPAASTCMNCHNQVLKDDPKLALVRESAATGKPIAWVQLHKTPDFVYFNHSVHVNRGISCVHCHGPVNKMDEVRHSKSLGMAFCLECHRDPAAKIRPVDQVYNLDWQAPEGFAKKEGAKLVKDWNVHPGESCSVCHR